jgi:uncharacterized protein YkwD
MKSKIRPELAVVSIALATFAGSCASSTAPTKPPSSVRQAQPKSEAAEPSHLVEAVVDAHNNRRSRSDRKPLASNPMLQAAAIDHARDMARRRKMSHKGSDGSSPFDRMKGHGYVFVEAAENVAYGFDDVDSVMDGWMKSPGHRRNILGNFSEIGVGRAIASDGASYWCVTFGTPAGH